MAAGTDGVYVSGITYSPDFPTTDGAVQRRSLSRSEAFASQFAFDGALVYSTYLGNGASATGEGLAVGPAGELYVTGFTRDARITPTLGGLNLPGRHFILKLNPEATRIEFAASGVGGSHITIAPNGDMVVAGTAGIGLPGVSESIPTTDDSFQPKANPALCGSGFLGFPCPKQFVLKLNASASRVVWGTWLTGSKSEAPAGVAIAPDGSILVAGTVTASDYPVTPDAMIPVYPSRTQSDFRTGRDSSGYLSRLSADGKQLLYSTFVGGSGTDGVNAMHIDRDGAVMLAGFTTSDDFPVSSTRPTPCLPREYKLGDPALTRLPAPGVRRQAWIARLTGLGTGIAASKVFGGKTASATSLDMDALGGVLATGDSLEPDFPLSPDVYHGLIGEAGVWLSHWTPSESGESELGCIADPADLTLTARVAPGRLLTLWGSGFGVPPQSFDSGAGQAPAELAGLRVLFDDIPGRLLYVSPRQINVVVPFLTARSQAVILRIEKNGRLIAIHRLGATQRTPRIFVKGEPDPASYALIPVANNEDGSSNSPQSPASPGSLVTLFLNGAGAQRTPVEDGAVSHQPLLPLDVPVTVSIRDLPLEVVSASAAEGQVAGVWQLKVRIPENQARLALLTVKVDGVLAHPLLEELLVWVTTPEGESVDGSR